jgi:formate dehydrogenase
METLFWVRDIVEQGASWFRGHGRNGRKGLRSFSVSGASPSPGCTSRRRASRCAS